MPRPVMRLTHPPIQKVPWPSLGDKRPEPEVNYSPAWIAKIKNKWSHTSIPPYSFVA